jgi:hypothetical protein
MQVRRNLHTYSPSQLVSVLSAVAAYPPGEGEPASASGWQPGRLFLYDVITHSAPGAVMNAWSGRQAAQVLWAFSRFRSVCWASEYRRVRPCATPLAQVQVVSAWGTANGCLLVGRSAHNHALNALLRCMMPVVWGFDSLKPVLPEQQAVAALCPMVLTIPPIFLLPPSCTVLALIPCCAVLCRRHCRYVPDRSYLSALTAHLQTQLPLCDAAVNTLLCCAMLCCCRCCRYVPDRSYLAALTAHLQTQLPLCDADALSMSLWALAALQQPLPSQEWGAAWCAAALTEADGFGPQALAHGLAGMATLKVQPTVELMQSLTLAASGCLSSFSCMELGLMVAALADLHWRPSDTWMAVS